MNDRFRFRAKRLDNNKFVYGYLCFIFSDVCRIYCSQEDKFYDCTTKTLGQCTGLKDKNGRLIYEGDLVKLPVNCNKELHGVYTTQEVVWRNGFWVLSYVSSQKGRIMPRGYSAGFLHDHLDDDFNEHFLFGNNDMFCKYKQLEVIGNIHENPELLEGK